VGLLKLLVVIAAVWILVRALRKPDRDRPPRRRRDDDDDPPDEDIWAALDQMK